MNIKVVDLGKASKETQGSVMGVGDNIHAPLTFLG
jgi:hypothetical protein